MITAGIDVGAVTTKVVILKEGKVIGDSIVSTGIEQKKSAEQALDEAIKKAGISRSDIERITATGTGSKMIDFASAEVTDVEADAVGVNSLYPQARTVIDVGAEQGLGIKVDEEGRAIDFAINERCAAGTGAFTEAMSRALEVKVEDMGELSRKSTKDVQINAQCAVFAESEVVSLIHAQTAKPDIARAINDAIAGRITSMVRRVGVEKDVALIGGVSKNIGFVDSLKKHLGVDLLLPDEPQIVSALGAAIIAARQDI